MFRLTHAGFDRTSPTKTSIFLFMHITFLRRVAQKCPIRKNRVTRVLFVLGL